MRNANFQILCVLAALALLLALPPRRVQAQSSTANENQILNQIFDTTHQAIYVEAVATGAADRLPRSIPRIRFSIMSSTRPTWPFR